MAAGSSRRPQWLLWGLDQGLLWLQAPGGPHLSLGGGWLAGAKRLHYCLGNIPGQPGGQGACFLTLYRHKVGQGYSHCPWVRQTSGRQPSSGAKGTGSEAVELGWSWFCPLPAK